MAYKDKDEKPKRFWFDDRRVERAGVVPVPIAVIALIAGINCIVAVITQQWLVLFASIVVAVALPLAIVAGSKSECYHDVALDVLAVRKGISWMLVAGFRATRLPTNVDGNQNRLLRGLSAIGKGITFRIIVSRHVFPRVVESRAGSWFEPEAASKQKIEAETAGHAWMLVLEKHVSLLVGMRREIAAFIQARDATASTFPNTYMHHGFRAINAEELARIVTL